MIDYLEIDDNKGTKLRIYRDAYDNITFMVSQEGQSISFTITASDYISEPRVRGELSHDVWKRLVSRKAREAGIALHMDRGDPKEKL